MSYFKLEKFKKWWCRFFHTAYKSTITEKYCCHKCHYSWDWLPETFFPQ